MATKGIGPQKPVEAAAPQTTTTSYEIPKENKDLNKILQDGLKYMFQPTENVSEIEIPSASYKSDFGIAMEEAEALKQEARQLALASPEFKELLNNKDFQSLTEQYLTSGKTALESNPKFQELANKIAAELCAKEKSAKFEIDEEKIPAFNKEANNFLLMMIGFAVGTFILTKLGK